MQSPLLADSRHSSVLVPRLCSCVLMAPQHCRHVSPQHDSHSLLRLCRHPAFMAMAKSLKAPASDSR